MKRLRITLMFSFYAFCIAISFAQKEANIWYFGNYAGLDFNSGSPVALTDGKLSTLEGCASISNQEGDLLFYTDGVTVWNRNHNVMLNGTGLKGHPSSTNSAIIVPKPDNPNIYYIFTTTTTAEPDGLRYSEVDMTLDGGSGGITTTKNILLSTPVTEQVTSIKNPLSNAYWVVSHKFFSNEFLAYKITSTGVNLTPVISPLGGEISDYYGAMKISPDGKKLAISNANAGNLGLCDFDVNTGKVSNLLDLKYGTYGVEFSPNSKLLYASSDLLLEEDLVDEVYQFNIESNMESEIIDSKVLITRGEVGSRVQGALQLATDGKIYVSTEDLYLDVINDPNIIGSGCNYVYNSVYLSGRHSNLGLPPFIQSYFQVEIETENVCFGDLTKFHLNNTETIDSILWDFGDPISGTNNTSTVLEPTHVFSAPGSYQVSVTATLGTEVSTITRTVVIYEVPVVSPLVEIKQCDDDLDGFSWFNLNEVINEISSHADNEIVSFYETESDANSAMDAIANPVNYINEVVSSDAVWARVENANGCYSLAEVVLYVSTTEIPEDFHVDLYACDDLGDGTGVFDLRVLDTKVEEVFPAGQDLDISYYKTLEDALTERNPASPIEAYMNDGSPYSQDLWVRVESKVNNDCIGLGLHIRLNVVSTELESIEGALICDGDTALLTAAEGFDRYLWSTGETTRNIEVSQPGNYSVTVTNDYWNTSCGDTQMVEVIGSGIATITGISAEGWDRDGNLVVVSVAGQGDYEYSLDGLNYQSGKEFRNIEPTINTVYIRDRNGCGIVEGNFYLLYYPRFFTPNGDGRNDWWQIGNGDTEPGNRLYIYDRYGKLLAELDPKDRGWDGTYGSLPMPSSDYWFVLKRQDGQTHKGHFSLKR